MSQEVPTSPSVTRNIPPVSEVERIDYERQLRELSEKQSLTPDDLATATSNLVALLGSEETTRSDGNITRVSTLKAHPLGTVLFETIDEPKVADRPLQRQALVHFLEGSSYQVYLEDGRAVTAYHHHSGGHIEGGSLERFDGARASRNYGMIYKTYNNSIQEQRKPIPHVS